MSQPPIRFGLQIVINKRYLEAGLEQLSPAEIFCD